METYKCSKCGMAVNASCASCDEPLRNDHLKLDDGTTVQISICPSCEESISFPFGDLFLVASNSLVISLISLI